MSLFVHHASRLDDLALLLADSLAVPLADPFQEEYVVVPTAGVRDWLLRRLATRLGAGATEAGEPRGDGVAANILTEFPARFVARALGNADAADDPWQLDRLTWTVLEVIGGGGSVPGLSIGRGEAGTGGDYARARRLADLFDRYAINRPSMIHQWSVGLDGDGTLDGHGAVVPLVEDQRWQAELWRAVRAAVGVPSRAEMLPDLLADLRSGASTVELPERLALFGQSTLSPGVLSVVVALSTVREVRMLVPHPSSSAWSRCPIRVGDQLVLRKDRDVLVEVRHPLLRSWGRPAMETTAMMSEWATASPSAPAIAAVVATDEPSTAVAAAAEGQMALDFTLPADRRPITSPGGALQRLQASVRSDDEQLTVSDADGAPDRSLQVHACHGAVRQLEVLRDALAHRFADDPSLHPRDVLIVSPDLRRFAPAARSVFHRGALPVPLRVSDLSLGVGNPVAAALLGMLAMLDGRATVPDVLAVAALPPVRHRLGITDDDLERFARWTAALGTTWGLDGEQRGEWIRADVITGTWSDALDRLLAGAAFPAPRARVALDTVAPFDDIDTDGFVSAGRLAELVHRLRAARVSVAGGRVVAAWCDVLDELVRSFLGVADGEAWQLAEVVASIDDLRRRSLVGAVDSSVRLGLGDVRVVVGERFDADTGRLNLRSGSVTLTSMVPVRNLPFTVVCILGLDEGTLRGGGADGDDLLLARPCIGERDPKAETRALLLDAVLAAGDQLIITCDGSDITTNRPLPLPVHVGELLDAVGHDRSGVDGGDRGAGIVVRHPRHAHDERNLVSIVGATEPGQRTWIGPESFAPGRPFAFDDTMRSAALARRQSRPTSRIDTVLSPVSVTPVTIAQLVEACARPARTYLRDRLDVRFPPSLENTDDHIPLAASPLDAYSLGGDLLDRWLAGRADPTDEWMSTVQLGGGLPPLRLADAALGEIRREVEAILADRAEAIGDTVLAAPTSVAIDVGLEVPTWAIDPASDLAPDGRLVDQLHGVTSPVLFRAVFTRPKARTEIRVALELAALCLAEPDVPWTATVVMRNAGNALKPTVRHLRPTRTDRDGAARRLLAVALDLRLRALRDPIPMLERSTRSLFEHGSIDDTDLKADLRDEVTAFLWAGLSADDLLAIPPLATDPLTTITPSGSTMPSRAACFAEVFWSAFAAFLPGSDDTPEGDDG